MSSEQERARRIFKRAKNGFYESIDDLEAEELGLLYLYYPWVLPDVEVSDSW